MKIAAAYAIADFVKEPNAQQIIPRSLNKNIAQKVASAVKEAYENHN